MAAQGYAAENPRKDPGRLGGAGMRPRGPSEGPGEAAGVPAAPGVPGRSKAAGDGQRRDAGCGQSQPLASAVRRASTRLRVLVLVIAADR